MSTNSTHHQFQLTPTRRWSRGRMLFVATLAAVSLAGAGVWRMTAQAHAVQPDLGVTPAAPPSMTVYKGPECDCCGKWITEMRKAGFTVEVVEQADMAPVKARLGVPKAAESCHTGTIGDYVIEGHVPPADITRLLADKPAVLGIAVPGMPTGTVGMDGAKVPYTVVSFDKHGMLATFAKR